MTTEQDLEKIKQATEEPKAELIPPHECCFCTEKLSWRDGIAQEAYQNKIGKRIELTDPCIHNQDSWLLWTHQASGFIGASFRDIAENLERDFIFSTLKDKAKMEKQLDALYEKWKGHSPWLELYFEKDKGKEFQYMEDFEEYVRQEKKKEMEQRTIEYEKAKECLMYLS